MKHFFGLELARRQTLAVAIFEQLIDLGSRTAKAPHIQIGAGDRLFFLPKRAIPEPGLMHALPLQPFITLPFLIPARR